MNQIRLTINGQPIETPYGTTILEAAKVAGIYIPTLCYHPDLSPAKRIQASPSVYFGGRKIENAAPKEQGKACGLCVVELEGQPDLVVSCDTEVREGMVVVTENDRITSKRQENLVPILARHRHACLTCAQQEGCSRSQCSANVPENERCCVQFGHCELQDVVRYIGISPSTPKWIPTDLPLFDSSPLFVRDDNLCIGCTRCVRACRDLRGVEALGFVFDEKGRIQVGTMAPSLEESGCRFCTACVEVCPTGALRDKAVRPGKEQEDLVPCREACPVHVDIPEYLRLVAEGRRDEANAVVRERVPFPGVLGRVCMHPCEEVCRRGQVNEPVSICALKRYAADGDKGLWKKRSFKKSDSGRSVAVVGSGPAGLTAAFYLRKLGHGVTVFEAAGEAGGMMRYGIPAYRLPREVLDREIREIFDLGITFKPNEKLGSDFSLDELKSRGYEAVFLAVGASLSRRISLEGAELPGVLWGIDFLREVAEGKMVDVKEKVIVVGGGNAAIDAALAAKRCGAREVTMVCLESRDEMPARTWEVGIAEAEGVRIIPSWGLQRILREKKRVTGVELVQCTSVFDAQGIFCPTFGAARTAVEGDQVIIAVGQTSDLSFLGDRTDIATKNGLIVVDDQTLATGAKAVYAGGDVAGAGGSVIHAVAAGRKAASSIDKALGGTGDIEEVLFQRGTPNPYLGRDEGFVSWRRDKVPELAPGIRSRIFSEVDLGFEDEQALREAKRCLQCDVRLFMGCNPSPPAKWLPFDKEDILQVPEGEGVFQLLDQEHNVLAIQGTAALRKDLLQALEENEEAVWFEFEADKMYSKRESELIQEYLQEHGEMPGSGTSDLDDLF